MNFFAQIMQDVLKPMNITFIILIFVTFFICLIWKKDKNLVTMWGILGTFIGIVLALNGLDTKNITESIPNLLEWLKTAFYTSIFGAIAAIVLSFLQKKEDNQEEVDFLKEISESQKGLEKNFEKFLDGQNEFSKNFLENQEKFAEKISESNEKVFSEMQNISKNTANNSEIVREIMNLSKNIGGEWDTSILTQIRNIRSDMNDNMKNIGKIVETKQDELIKEFQIFAEKIGDASMEKMIEAVQRVMDDFDKKINEQLGQSFQDLKWAIDNLLLWQGEYKENIIKQTEWLESSNKNLQISVESLGNVTEKSERFAEISEKFGNWLDNLDASLGILKSGISEFDKVAENQKISSEKMIESIDSLKNNFVSSAENIVKDSENHIKNMKDMLQNQKEDIESTHKNILENLQKNIESQSENFKKEFARIHSDLASLVGESVQESQKTISRMKTEIEDFGEKLQEIFEVNVREMQENYEKMLEKANSEISQNSQSVIRMRQAMENDWKEFDKAMQEELSKSISTLGQQLASLSGKFVSDYGNLAEKLERLVQTSNNR